MQLCRSPVRHPLARAAQISVGLSPLTKKETRTSSANVPNSKKKREGTQTSSKQGAGLKGHEDHETQTSNHTKAPETPNNKQTSSKQSLRGIITAGWRGPWAALPFWGVAPWDRSTEGSEDPPTTGTAPGSAIAIKCPTQSKDPKRWGPALSRSTSASTAPSALRSCRTWMMSTSPSLLMRELCARCIE